MPKETKEERVAHIQTRGYVVVAGISAFVTLIVGLITAFFAFPPFQESVRSWGQTVEPQTLAIEKIQQDIFAYAGNNNPDGGAATFVLIVDDENIPNYKLDYSLPNDKYGFAGLAFNFHGSADLSEYNAIECIIVFSQPINEIDLYFKDISNNFSTIRVVSNGESEMSLRYELKNFPKINFNAVKEVGMVASTEFSKGTYQIIVKSIRFI